MKRATANPHFELVREAFTAKELGLQGGKGFGSGALKVNGRIFAMMSSKGEFVVKLPKSRVDELVAAGKGVPFDPGRGKLMKEWLVVLAGESSWSALAREAYRFVKG